MKKLKGHGAHINTELKEHIELTKRIDKKIENSTAQFTILSY